MKIFIFLAYTVIIYNYNHNYTVILGDINTKVDNEKVTGVTDAMAQVKETSQMKVRISRYEISYHAMRF